MGNSFSLVAGFALSLQHITLSYAQNTTCVDLSQVNSSNPLPYFQARFPDYTLVAPTRPPYLGGRNQTYCCIQAIEQYLRNNCSNAGLAVQVSDRILGNLAQFPCGALWDGDIDGAPQVLTTYQWATQTCPGWELSQAANVNQWAQLLVGFLLPAIVFSFNVPRPRKLKIWEKLFPEEISSYKVLSSFAGIVIAAISVTIDTIVWLIVVFAFAGPLLLSGLYEAQLDQRMLQYLQEHIKHDKIPLALRARILFTILCGNLDLYPAWSDTMDLARNLDELDRPTPEVLHAPQFQPSINIVSPDGSQRPGPSRKSSTFRSHSPHSSLDVARSSLNSNGDSGDEQDDTVLLRGDKDENPKALLRVITHDHAYSSRNSEDSITLSRIKTDGSTTATEPLSTFEVDGGSSANSAFKRRKNVRKVTVRLRAMLSCQYSFGSTIGGPVVFFLGSFIYALLEMGQDTGDEDVAEALAFGMWWIIIPVVAAVAGLLLAGNNPSILEGIVSVRDLQYAVGESFNRRPRRRDTIEQETGFRLRLLESYSTVVERVYDAKYNPAWMWDRGRSKQDWLLILFVDSWLKYEQNGRLPQETRKCLENFLIDGVMLTVGDWAFLLSFAFLLILLPCTFGFLTAYYTPTIGIACRAITFLVYMGAQTLLLLLWTHYLTYRDKYWATGRKIKQVIQSRDNKDSEHRLMLLVSQLKSQALLDTQASSRRKASQIAQDLLTKKDADHPAIKWTFYMLCAFGFFISLISSMGGTLMQIMGVYRNNLCLLTANKWTYRKRPDTYITLSTNTVQAIHEAQQDWTIIGSFSVVFLGVVSYIGWWYQKRLRALFKVLAGKLAGDDEEEEEEMKEWT